MNSVRLLFVRLFPGVTLEIQSSRESTNAEFPQQVTLGTSNMTPPRCPSPSTLTNHIGVSDRRAKSVAILQIGYGKSYLLVSSAGLDTFCLVHKTELPFSFFSFSNPPINGAPPMREMAGCRH